MMEEIVNFLAHNPGYYNKLFWSIAIAVGLIMAIYHIRKSDLGFSYIDIILTFLVIFNLGLVGAKLASILEHILINNLRTHSGNVISHSGGRIYGSIFVVFLSFILFYLVTKREVALKILDVTSLIFCLAKGIGDIGCQFSGDGCYGGMTSLPWGVNYHWGMYPTVYPVHPTPIYNFVFHTLFFFVLLMIYNRKQFAGQILTIYLGGIGLYHFFLELIRVNQPIWGPFSLSHFFYFVFFCSSFPLYYWFKRYSVSQVTL